MNKSEWNVRLLNCYKATIDILERIKNKTIYQYKILKQLRDKGVVSIKNIWIKIHYPHTLKLSLAPLK